MYADMRRFGNFSPEGPETGETGSSRLSAGFSPVLELSDLSDQELAEVELPVGDEALDQGSHLLAVEPTKRLARVERRLVQPDRRRHHRRRVLGEIGETLRGQREERRLSMLSDTLPLLAGELLEPKQAQGEQVTGARITATGQEEHRPRLCAHDELELRVTALAEAIDDLGGRRHLHRRAIGNMNLERRRGRVGDDRPVDLAGREAQRPSRRLTDASSSISSPSGDSAIRWARAPRSLRSEVVAKSSRSCELPCNSAKSSGCRITALTCSAL